MRSSENLKTTPLEPPPLPEAAQLAPIFRRVPRKKRSQWSLWKHRVTRAMRWISPFRVWRELRQREEARRDFAAGVAVGVFIACVPLYGFQTVLSLYAARKLSLHPLPVLAGSQLSSPPVVPALTIASLVLGRIVLTGTLPHLADWNIHNLHLTHWRLNHLPHLSVSAVNLFVGSWLVGGILLGLILGSLTYLAGCIAMRALFGHQSGKK